MFFGLSYLLSSLWESLTNKAGQLSSCWDRLDHNLKFCETCEVIFNDFLHPLLFDVTTRFSFGWRIYYGVWSPKIQICCTVGVCGPSGPKKSGALCSVYAGCCRFIKIKKDIYANHRIQFASGAKQCCKF